jgi:poly(hydroxyalkanoate) depolymerase family esterase
MNHDFVAAMRRAAAVVRQGDIAGATQTIREALNGAKVQPTPPVSDDRAAGSPQRERRPLGEVLHLLRKGRAEGGIAPALPGGEGRASRPGPHVADGALYLSETFAGPAGTRAYRLYVPASARRTPRALLVMLHGCKQDPDDFAKGSRMNEEAETHGLVVAYPAQVSSANPSSCWNWFNPTNQVRDSGEPSIIAGITRDIVARYDVPTSQVFVAGLSAGGAMAAVMAETYPDLYSAVGIHSGLPYGAASDVVSAFAAMRGEARAFAPNLQRGAAEGSRIRTIVFHGSADQTVSPANAQRIADAARRRFANGTLHTEAGASDGGRTYTRTIIRDSSGAAAAEFWMIDGAGHAWSGGHPDGSFTDPRGPHSSAEMVRFFIAPER